MDNENLCAECGERDDHDLHHDMPDVVGNTIPDDPHTDACNVEAYYSGDPLTQRATMDCHEFEAGCTCADAGKCEVCVERAVDQADYMRDMID